MLACKSDSVLAESFERQRGLLVVLVLKRRYMLKIDLTGKIAVVTGSTGQLGRVMARTLAGCGANIAIHYHANEQQADKLVDSIHNMGRRAMKVRADVTVEAEVYAMRDAIRNALGATHIIVNNAVIQYKWKRVLEQSLEDYESQFRSSVLQSVIMAKAFVADMAKAKYGRIIGISSECAMQAGVGQSAYVSGKRGMDGVLRALAKEIGEHNITVNQVAPGWTLSERDRGIKAMLSRPSPYAQEVPLRRRDEDQEIANVVAFLASDLASFITGAFIPVCGGNVMPAI
jgi:3-oxoacyl-[acyl-carrier protein] reductase